VASVGTSADGLNPAALAEKQGALLAGPPTFYVLDLIEDLT
jgi:hypothetical protein